MRNWLSEKSWSPFAVGAGIGVLSWFAFLTADHPLGITTAFEHTAAIIGRVVMPSATQTHAYFHQNNPRIGWEWMLVIGVFVGAFSSAWFSGDRTTRKVPPLWMRRFGGSVSLRFSAAFLGGALMMFGARLAHGCTSGHGISGTLQLATSSWLFTAILFAVGIATSFLIYPIRSKVNSTRGKRHV